MGANTTGRWFRFPTLTPDCDLSYSGAVSAIERYWQIYAAWPTTLIHGQGYNAFSMHQRDLEDVSVSAHQALMFRTHIKHIVYIPGWSDKAWGVLGQHGMVIIKGA